MKRKVHSAGRSTTDPGTIERRNALPWVLIVLAALVMYLPALHFPFLADDYVFIDETRYLSFVHLWSRSHVAFGWYRPLSRELYFWALQRAVGLNPQAFRALNLFLWISSLLLLGSVVRRLANERTAVLAVAGTAVLGLWGSTLLWVSGSQDLLLVFFTLLTVYAEQGGQRLLATCAFAAALLSKETAAVVPIVLVGMWRFNEGYRIRQLLRRVWPYVAVLVSWLLWHPILLPRLFHPNSPTLVGEPSLPPLRLALRLAQALCNADQLGGHLNVSWANVVSLGLGGVLLAIAVFVAERASSEPLSADQTRRATRTGGVWAAAGWIPLFMPSIGYHAYYGCIGAIGAWLALSAWGRDRVTSVTLILALAVLRLFNSSTESTDWGNDWYQRRAADLMGQIREQLLAIRPTVPAHSRIYFGGIPNNIGLVAGDSPALRVWYGDSVLTGGFYSQYRPRSPADPSGPDLFFHYDPLNGLREVRLGAEDVEVMATQDPVWRINHESLASLLWHAGDLSRAADEYAKVGQLPGREDAVIAAAACRLFLGDTATAHMLAQQVATRTHRPIGQVEATIDTVRAKIVKGLTRSAH